MSSDGRTFAEAAIAGDCYMVRQGRRNELLMPGCRGLVEALEAAAFWGTESSYVAAGVFQPGATVQAYRVLPGSVFGCLFVEEAGEHVLPPARETFAEWRRRVGAPAPGLLMRTPRASITSIQGRDGTMNEQRDWIDTAEQGRLVRAALKRHFPAVRFSVRIQRYAGGSCVNVRWVDGPTDASVREIAGSYDGERFDGSIDLRYGAMHYLLPDGSAVLARTYGHSYESAEYKHEGPPPEGACLVRFAGSVSIHRELSPEWEDELAAELAAFVGLEPGAFGARREWWQRSLNVSVDRETGGLAWNDWRSETVATLVRGMGWPRTGKPRQATHASAPELAGPGAGLVRA